MLKLKSEKKLITVFICIGLIIILLLSIISAGFFSDFWNKITGKEDITGYAVSGNLYPETGDGYVEYGYFSSW